MIDIDSEIVYLHPLPTHLLFQSRLAGQCVAPPSGQVYDVSM